MLQKVNRFHGLGSVRPALKYGQRIRGSNMAASVLASKKTTNLFAVLVSKKVSKKAVVRNRIRRRIFAVIEAELPKLINNRPTDVVISAFSQQLKDCDFDELTQEVIKLLQKARLYS